MGKNQLLFSAKIQEEREWELDACTIEVCYFFHSVVNLSPGFFFFFFDKFSSNYAFMNHRHVAIFQVGPRITRNQGTWYLINHSTWSSDIILNKQINIFRINIDEWSLTSLLPWIHLFWEIIMHLYTIDMANRHSTTSQPGPGITLSMILENYIKTNPDATICWMLDSFFFSQIIFLT